MVAWTLVFHLIGIVFWLGSLLVVTHILAIHTEASSTEARAVLGRLEMRLLKGLARPGAALVLVTGVALIAQRPHYLSENWLRTKLFLVIVLIILDLRVYFRSKAFLAGRIELRRPECMVLHGAISLLFFGVLILVLLKPFSMTRRASAPVRPRPAPALPQSPCLAAPNYARLPDRTDRG